MSEFKIGTLAVGGHNPCRFIAEISNNHNGYLPLALELIDKAKEAGCDAVKFQCYTPDELVVLRGDGPAPEPWGSQGWSMRQLYEKAQTPLVWFPALVGHCNQIGMPWFSSVFGPESLAMLELLKCPAYKIARLDNSSDELFKLFVQGRGRRPVIVSTADEMPRTKWGFAHRLYCPPGYPQTAFNFKRWAWPTLDGDCDIPGTFDVFDGFSFHGTDFRPCTVAATLGAKLIEFHLQASDEPSRLESGVSLTEIAAAGMIRTVRRNEMVMA